jgi:hypothetical protein
MKSLPNTPLELTIFLWKEMRTRELYQRNVTGILPIDLDFQAVELALELHKLSISSNEAQRKIEFRLHKNFFMTLENLISVDSRRISSPESFYLADSDFLYDTQIPETELPIDVKNYLGAVRFYSLLGEIADYKNVFGSITTLIFLGKEKLEIKPNYTLCDLRELPKLNDFEINFIAENAAHKEQKRTIVHTVLLEIFEGYTDVRFADLLVKFDDFIEKLNCSYNLYVSEFSFQKVKDEIEKEKLDATIKLNKVFSDIQNQLLSIPAALVFVGGQMSFAGNWTIKNLSIWLGFCIFAALMSLLIRNQRHTLDAVKQEIDQQWQQIKNKHSIVADRFKASYEQLGNRHKHQEWLIKVIDTLVSICLAATTIMLLMYSVPQNVILESVAVTIILAIGFYGFLRKPIIP